PIAERRDTEQLDAIAELIRSIDVGVGDRLDAFDVDLVEGHARAEDEARQKRELVRGIEAADVEGRVRLRIALGLCLSQHLGKWQALFLHLAEDVIAGAIEDAGYAADLIA